jgi:hypothetical protein
VVVKVVILINQEVLVDLVVAEDVMTIADPILEEQVMLEDSLLYLKVIQAEVLMPLQLKE